MNFNTGMGYTSDTGIRLSSSNHRVISNTVTSSSSVLKGDKGARSDMLHIRLEELVLGLCHTFTWIMPLNYHVSPSIKSKISQAGAFANLNSHSFHQAFTLNSDVCI